MELITGRGVSRLDLHATLLAAIVFLAVAKPASAASELMITQTDGPRIHVKGDVAWAIGIATALVKLKSGAAFTTPTYEMDVFEKRDGRWLLVSHVALRVPK